MKRCVDLARLRSTFASPEFARLIDALQKRLELGRPLTGTLTLSAATPVERDALDGLLGRKSTRGASLQVDLDFLAVTLRDAGICDDLASAVEALRGPVLDRRGLAAEREEAWSAFWRSTSDEFASLPLLQPWFAKLASLGSMKRLCNDSPATATTLIGEIARVAKALPAAAEPLASFAARLFGAGDARERALDHLEGTLARTYRSTSAVPHDPSFRGWAWTEDTAGWVDPTSRATLALRAAARIGSITFMDDAEGRRAAWASVGVMCDELSTPALVFNLSARGDTPLARLLQSAVQDAEPVHVSLRLLLRSPLTEDSGIAGKEVFVCENPTIVALAATRLGRACAPLVCVNGQFATPSLVLLRQLRDAGAQLRYHGDFDPAGLLIARRVMNECGAKAWRFSAADYATAPKGVRFAGAPGATPWDEELRNVMHIAGYAVHEEAVFASLAEDLARVALP